VIACGNATGERFKFIHQALKGRNIYVALSGLVMMIIADLGRCPKLSNYRPFGALSHSFLEEREFDTTAAALFFYSPAIVRTDVFQSFLA
jgi:hypothetical protein